MSKEGVMTQCDDDLVLVAAARSGETEAFGLLVRRYQDRLHAPVARITGSNTDAADVLQDAFVRAYQKLALFNGESSFYTWIYRIAINQAMTYRRRGKVRQTQPLQNPREEPSSLDDPSLPLERAERERLVQLALGRLDPANRAVVVLKDLEGLRYEEIAKILEIPIGTVRSRLHRARSALREMLVDMDLDESASRRTPPVFVVASAESGTSTWSRGVPSS
jgi:RNA polymerase sigma-70 factor (ECF subfamily)